MKMLDFGEEGLKILRLSSDWWDINQEVASKDDWAFSVLKGEGETGYRLVIIHGAQNVSANIKQSISLFIKIYLVK